MASGCSRLFRGFKTFAQGFFIGVPVCLTFVDNFFTVCFVEGISMQPALNPDDKGNDIVLINRWKAKKFHKIEKGHIVSIIYPKDPDSIFIKRIIGLEGDTIRTLSHKNRYVKIPRGHCWIEGDNHGHSVDSNSFGSVPLGLVTGVATAIVWPPSRWGTLSSVTPRNRNPFDTETENELDEETQLVMLAGDSRTTCTDDSLESRLTNKSKMDSIIDDSLDLLVPRVSKDKANSSTLLTHLHQNNL